MPRRVVAAFVLSPPEQEGERSVDWGIAAICADGAFYAFSWRHKHWTQLPGIPGTAGAKREDEEKRTRF